MTWIGSPNFWPGRNEPIRKIVIHWMVGTLASTDKVFTDPASARSAHHGIEDWIRHGYVKESDRAWHSLQANHWTIGIELSAGPGRPASDATYTTCIQLCAEICKRYNLTPDDIVPHSKYVNTQCCGTVDINRIKEGVKQLLGEEMQPATYEEANIYYQTICFEDLTKENFEKYHKGKTRFQLFDEFRQAPVRKQRLQAMGEAVNTVRNLNERIAQMTVQMEALKKDGTKELTDALQKRLETTSKELEKVNKQLKDLQLEKEEGLNWLQRLAFAIGQLFKKG